MVTVSTSIEVEQWTFELSFFPLGFFANSLYLFCVRVESFDLGHSVLVK
jgi:hypothetical protein